MMEINTMNILILIILGGILAILSTLIHEVLILNKVRKEKSMTVKIKGKNYQVPTSSKIDEIIASIKITQHPSVKEIPHGGIKLYRFGKKENGIDLKGYRLPFSGLWNEKGTPIVYSLGSASAAAKDILTQSISPSISNLFKKLKLFSISVPSGVSIKILNPKDLPADWKNPKNLETLQKIGTNWVLSRETCILEVPSIKFPNEKLYLINPLHPEIKFLSAEIVENKEAYQLLGLH